MADKQADDDDDESFGDFTFASFPNQSPLPPPSISATGADEEDDWGDFVNDSSQSQINGGFAKPCDPFGASLDPDGTTRSSHVNDGGGSTKNGVAVRPAWKKPEGAIPLSIFGEEEEEEVEEEKKEQEPPAIAFSNKGDSAKKGSDTNGSIRISDLFSSLYNQSNGSVSKSDGGGAPPSSNAASNESNNLNSDLVEGDDDDDGWDFQTAEWGAGMNTQNVKDEVPNHDNGVLDVGTTWGSTTGNAEKASDWNAGFEFSPSSAPQDHTIPQLGQKSESNETKTESFNPNFGELNTALSWPGSYQNWGAQKMTGVYPTSVEVLKFDAGSVNSTIGPSIASESHQSAEWGFSLAVNSSSPGKESHISESYLKTKSDQDDNNKSNASPTNSNVDLDVNLFESKGEVTEVGTQNEKLQISSRNSRGALLLSIFGNEIADTEEHSLPPFAPTSPMKNSITSPGSNLSINDIWNLYSQAENKTSANVIPKASENVINVPPGVSSSDMAAGDDDFDDDFWDYKDASPGTTLAHEYVQNPSLNLASQVNEIGLHSSPTVLNSDLINGDGFEDDSWEFKDATSGTRSEDLSSVLDHRDVSTQSSTKLELQDYVDFYRKLKDELSNAVLFHLQKIKEAQRVAVHSGEDAKEKSLQGEIQEFSKIMHQDDIIPKEFLSEDYSPRDVHFDELYVLLGESKFQSLESEYRLSSKLSMAEKDMKSAMEFLKDTLPTLRVLMLGSQEEQSNYLAAWSKIAFVCSQELKHGTNIWKQAVQKKVHHELLSNPKGARYILALGEICRVAEIIGASTKFYKPWMLLGSTNSTSLFALLNECYSIWSSSGLEEALIRISNPNNFEPDGISMELVKSIKYIHELDERSLQSYVISGEEITCHLSALPAGVAPGLNMVKWNGKHYFIMLANLWANLISSDPPQE